MTQARWACRGCRDVQKFVLIMGSINQRADVIIRLKNGPALIFIALLNFSKSIAPSPRSFIRAPWDCVCVYLTWICGHTHTLNMHLSGGWEARPRWWHPARQRVNVIIPECAAGIRVAACGCTLSLFLSLCDQRHLLLVHTIVGEEGKREPERAALSRCSIVQVDTYLCGHTVVATWLTS